MARILTASLLLAAVLPPVVSGQIPPGYFVQQITDNNIREAWPRVNDRGQIVYEARLDGSGESGEIFLYDSRTDQTTRITNDNVRDAFPDINGDGVLTWTRFIGPAGEFGPTGEIMIRDPQGNITRLTDDDTDDFAPELNEHGHIAWSHWWSSGCEGSSADIFFYDGQSIIRVTTDGVPMGLHNQSPKLNDLDQIAYVKFDFCPSPWHSQIWLWEAGNSIELTDGQFEPASPDLDNLGVVAWFHRPGNGHAIQLWENGNTRDLTDWGTGPRLNDSGHISFIRWHNDTGNWQQWLYRDSAFWQLSDDPFWNTDGHINALGEVAWRSGPANTSDIRYLRRFDLGDLNCDMTVNAFDIEPFLVALFDPQEYPNRHPACDSMLADVDGDGTVNAFDIEPFINLLFP